MITRGTYCNPLSNLRKNFFAACLFRRRLPQDIEDVAILINGSPEGVLLPIDSQENLIQVPRISCFPPTFFQLIGVGLSEFQTPLPNGFIGQYDPTFSHDLFHITVTEREAKIQPETMTDHLRWEA